MATLKLKVSDKILDKVLWLLKQFKSEDLEIIERSSSEDELYVKEQYNRLKSGKGKTYNQDQLDELLERSIRKYEN